MEQLKSTLRVQTSVKIFTVKVSHKHKFTTSNQVQSSTLTPHTLNCGQFYPSAQSRQQQCCLVQGCNILHNVHVAAATK